MCVWFCFRYEGSIQPESLKIVLEYTLARGNLKSIFKVLKLLYGKWYGTRILNLQIVGILNKFMFYLQLYLFVQYLFVHLQCPDLALLY